MRLRAEMIQQPQIPAAEDALAEISRRYGKPATLGASIVSTIEDRSGERGVIVGAEAGQLLVRLEGRDRPTRLHPTYAIRYV